MHSFSIRPGTLSAPACLAFRSRVVLEALRCTSQVFMERVERLSTGATSVNDEDDMAVEEFELFNVMVDANPKLAQKPSTRKKKAKHSAK